MTSAGVLYLLSTKNYLHNTYDTTTLICALLSEIVLIITILSIILPELIFYAKDDIIPSLRRVYTNSRYYKNKMAHKYLDKDTILEMYINGWSPNSIAIMLSIDKELVKKCIKNLQKKN
jgi:hypothetical protein